MQELSKEVNTNLFGEMEDWIEDQITHKVDYLVYSKTWHKASCREIINLIEAELNEHSI